jgi:hypothetical protein
MAPFQAAWWSVQQAEFNWLLASAGIAFPTEAKSQLM